MNSNIVKLASCLALLVVPSTASAQLGGLGGLVKKGLGGDSGVSGDEAEQFLTGAFQSTKNVMIAAALISDAVRVQKDATSSKIKRDALLGAQTSGELESQLSNFQSDVQVLNTIASDAAPLDAAYKAGNAEQKKMLGIALVNLAIGIARNVELAGKAPGAVSAVGRNPKLLSRAGQFKAAAKLIGLQTKSLTGFAASLPKLMAAAKVKAPAKAEASTFTAISSL